MLGHAVFWPKEMTVSYTTVVVARNLSEIYIDMKRKKEFFWTWHNDCKTIFETEYVLNNDRVHRTKRDSSVVRLRVNTLEAYG